MQNEKDSIDEDFLRDTRINIGEKAKYIKKMMMEKQEIDLYQIFLGIRRPEDGSCRIMTEVISAKFFKIAYPALF